MNKNTIEFESLVGWMDWVLERESDLLHTVLECVTPYTSSSCRLWAYTKQHATGSYIGGPEIPMILGNFDVLSPEGDVYINVLHNERDKIERAYERLMEFLRGLREGEEL